MRPPLCIKALAFTLGCDEREYAPTLIVHWHGTPFTHARVAVDAFLDACRSALKPPPPARATCCEELLKSMPRAKACPTCGIQFGIVRKSLTLAEYFQRLLRMDADDALDKMYPHHNEPEDAVAGNIVLGHWAFFEGFPIQCDVVVVEGLDVPFQEYGASGTRYYVIHVGKASKRAAACGVIVPERAS